MKKATTAMLTLAGLLVITSFVLASAQMGQQGRGFRAETPFQGRMQQREFARHRSVGLLRVLETRQEELNISDSQIEKIRGLTLKLEEKRVEQQNMANTMRLEMRKLMSDRDNVDYDQLRALLLKDSANKVDMKIDSMQLSAEIQAVLTPEQKEALKSLTQERRGLRRRGFNRNRTPRDEAQPRRFRRIPEDSSH
jgi:Spy/CpxP family protein refolding chaperone